MTIYSVAQNRRGWWSARASFPLLISLFPAGIPAQHVYECATNPPTSGILGKTFTIPLDECIIPVSDSYRVHSWGAQMGVATKGGARVVPFCFVPSTQVNSTIIMDAEMCQPDTLNGTTLEQCRSLGGNFIDRSELDGMNPYDIWSDNFYLLPPGQIHAPWPFEYAAHTTLTADSLKMKMDIGITGIVEFEVPGNVAPTKQAQLGLAQNSTFLNRLYGSGLATGYSWALDVGSVSDEKPRKGSMVFGGFDQNKKGSDDWHEVSMDYAGVQYGRHCPLQLKIDKVELEVQPSGGRPNKKTLFEPKSQVSACLEPNDYPMKFPAAVHNEFLRHLKDAAKVEPLPSNSFKPTSELFIPEPGLALPSKQATFSITLIVTLAGGFVVEIPSHEMTRSLRGLGADGYTLIDEDMTEIAVSSTSPASAGNMGDEVFSLGRSFLSQVYLFVSREERILRLSHPPPNQNQKANPKPWICDSMNVGLHPTDYDGFYGPPQPFPSSPPTSTTEGGIPPPQQTETETETDAGVGGSESRPTYLQIAGIVSAVGGLAFILLVGSAWWFCYGKYMREERKKNEMAQLGGLETTGYGSSDLSTDPSTPGWGKSISMSETSPEIKMVK
ncbi:hypothetical protein V8F33_009623 [Rhypophila sp. PSN 637]